MGCWEFAAEVISFWQQKNCSSAELSNPPFCPQWANCAQHFVNTVATCTKFSPDRLRFARVIPERLNFRTLKVITIYADRMLYSFQPTMMSHVSIRLDDNVKTIADICFLLGSYVYWRKIPDKFAHYDHRSSIKVIFQRVQDHTLRLRANLLQVWDSISDGFIFTTHAMHSTDYTVERRPSVTHRYSVETAKHIKLFHHQVATPF